MEVARLLAPIPLPGSVVDSGVLPRPMPDTFETHEQYLNVALIESVKAGNEGISEYLLSEGADINSFDSVDSGGTPLFYAITTNQLRMVSFLLASGADPNLCTGYRLLPLFIAAAHNHNVDIVRALLAAGTDIHVRDMWGGNVLAYCRKTELLRFFLERGVDPNIEDQLGETPIHQACRKANVELAKDFVELLLQFGAATVEKADHGGRTPVDIAMGRGCSDLVKILEPLVQDPDLRSQIAAWWDAFHSDAES